MRLLHPDKVGRSPEAERAVEMAREAKEACERSLLRLEPPAAPRDLRSAQLCDIVGRRRIELRWRAPEDRMTAPVRRYVVAALDPTYGRPLTVTVLEPDYSQELRRFVPVQELTSYVLAEEELQKMPALWQQSAATVQVAAANECGQSPWATVEAPLLPRENLPATPQMRGGSCSPQSASSSSLSPWEPRGGGRADDARFELELRRLRGLELRMWLLRQTKASIASWLKSLCWASSGTKEELVERVLLIIEGGPYKI